MASIIRMLSPATDRNGNTSRKAQDVEPEPEITPLVKMLQNAGPIRPDGSDKFFGLENFGNTCYANSILQALYYSVPFRENVVKYPPHSPSDTPNGQLLKLIVPTRAPQPNGVALSTAKPKGISAAEALKRRQAMNSGQPGPGVPGTRPEDKPDSPEYKKKHAMMAGPILEITTEHASSYGMEETTFTALKDIFTAMISHPSRTGVVSPQRFLEVFRRDNEMFRTSMHQDAHEFYGLMLNAVINNVEDNARHLRDSVAPQDKGGINDSMTAAVRSVADSMGLASGAQSPGTKWVHDIFEGKMVSETKCLTCETTSQRDETFLDLSIDLEKNSSVTSCLQKFSAEEMLCEKNKFHCDTCGGLQEAEKRMKIKTLPKVLVLHLKRFKWTDDLTRLQKLFYTVNYPYHLRMFNTTDDAEDPDRLYELYAVVVHIGTNAFHGHYVAVIKTEDRGWLLFDDEMVEPVDKSFVRQFFGDKPGQACAYVLFYRETTVEAMRKDQEAEGLDLVAAASEVADISSGHLQQNGTYLSSNSKQVLAMPSTPIETDTNGFRSLDHAVTAPTLISSVAGNPVPSRTPTSPLEAFKPKTKEEKERGKKFDKEAKKNQKAFEKANEKIAAKERKAHVAELKKTNAFSKQTGTGEMKRRQSIATTGQKENNGNEKSDSKGFGGLSLSRGHKGSKSMSRKSLGFLSGKNGEKEKEKEKEKNGEKSGENSNIPGSGSSTNLNAAVEGTSGPQTPEKHERVKKERFSFGGLGRKKSSLWSPGGG
ncbi:566a74af-750d-4e13-8cbb-6eaab4db9f93 [Sclerotinia trifoliorum]|uniref:Ubiquitin carboxyl-terminal hydrolase n=1 Tax=Sclerotinia trifoliorum TaxID=28548 RepID=A0A8H2ZV55_9HELO|nr:566a74af-750d-4e13-8cbb-6eaab4db9f93 [Sclerotinia trifoliorum]